jgi:hypothetical protein
VEAPTAIDCHRSAQREDCRFRVMAKRKFRKENVLKKQSLIARKSYYKE